MKFFQDFAKDFEIPKNPSLLDGKKIIEEEDSFIDNNSYSYSIENRQLHFPFKQFKQTYMQIKIKVTNNGENQWIENKTQLICSQDSNLKITDIKLKPLKTNQSQDIAILVDHLDELSEGEYKIILEFVVNKKKFDEPITIILQCEANKDLEHIKLFRINFELDENDYSDEQLYEALKKSNFDYEKAFYSLFD